MTEAEIDDCREEQSGMREELTHRLLELEKLLKLRLLIIEHFIPLNEAKQITSLFSYDEESQAWSTSRNTPTSILYVH